MNGLLDAAMTALAAVGLAVSALAVYVMFAKFGDMVEKERRRRDRPRK